MTVFFAKYTKICLVITGPCWRERSFQGSWIPEDQTRASGNEVLVAHIPLCCPVWFCWSCYAAVLPDRWRWGYWMACPWLQTLRAPCPGCTSDRVRNPYRFRRDRSLAKTSLTRRVSAYQLYYYQSFFRRQHAQQYVLSKQQQQHKQCLLLALTIRNMLKQRLNPTFCVFSYQCLVLPELITSSSSNPYSTKFRWLQLPNRRYWNQFRRGQGREIALPANFTRLVSYFKEGRGTGTTHHARLTSHLLPHGLSEI